MFSLVFKQHLSVSDALQANLQVWFTNIEKHVLNPALLQLANSENRMTSLPAIQLKTKV